MDTASVCCQDDVQIGIPRADRRSPLARRTTQINHKKRRDKVLPADSNEKQMKGKLLLLPI